MVVFLEDCRKKYLNA